MELVAQAEKAEREGKKSEAWLLRSRLKNGDFQEGDRIVLTAMSTGRVDTVLVRAGKVIPLVGMSDLSLEGVLRSELSDTLRQHLSKYVKNPDVRTMPLIPITVLGNVATSGYYYVASDLLLRDVLMRAGIPPTADLDKVVIRRGGETIWKASDVRVALTEGLSLDRLHLLAGDEIFVPQRRQRASMQTVFTVVTSVTTLFYIVSQLAR